MKRKILSLFLITSLTVLSTACGSDADETATESATEAVSGGTETTEAMAVEATETEEPEPGIIGELTVAPGFTATETDSTITMGEEISGDYSILVNEATGEIVAEKSAFTQLNPASMTKVLTVLVACENLSEEDLDATVVVPFEATDYSYVNDCSNVGFEAGETVTVRDLLYGTILPSGADAAVTLAIYIAGSQENFVNLMNDKLTELGLSETSHFTNCVGVYDENHYTTAYDMSMILKAALENPTAYEVLSCHYYATAPDEFYAEGIGMSNWFLRRIEDRIGSGTVVAGKTGFVNESGSCAVSYFVSATNVPYICVVAHSDGTWGCIADHVTVYDSYAP